MGKLKLEEGLCRLCLEPTNEENRKLIDACTREVLNILLLQQNVDEGFNTIACNECSIKLSAAFDFKEMCLDTEGCIYNHIVSEKDEVLDLKDVYLKEKGDENRSIGEEEKVCRLCTQIVTCDSVSLADVDPDMIEKYIPEVNFCATIDPVLCERCYKSLVRHSVFIRACLDTEQRIRYVSSGDNVHLKSEEIEIKTEQRDDDTSFNEETDRNHKISPDFHEETGINHKTETSENTTQPTDNIEPPKIPPNPFPLNLFSCDKCVFKCLYWSDLLIHKLIHNRTPVPKPVVTLKCDKCKYETTTKKYFKRHQLRHTDRSLKPTFKCDKCPFETTYKSCMSLHNLRHKGLSEVETYKCDHCDYVTIFKSYFRNHQVCHKSPSELKMHKCESCPFQTKHKKCFVRHTLTHKDSLDVQMYKCDSCAFETRHRNSYLTHQLKHKGRGEVELFKCNNCEYETKRKIYLIRHQLTHRKPSEVQMFKCGKCDFESKHKGSVHRHQARHQADPPVKGVSVSV